MEEPVYDGLENTGQEAHREAVDSPERPYQLERPRVGSRDCQENRNQGPYQSNRPHYQPHQAEWFLGPPAATVGLSVGRIDR